MVDEYAADVVRSTYRRKLEGMRTQAIAEQLNSENVLAPSEYKTALMRRKSRFPIGSRWRGQSLMCRSMDTILTKNFPILLTPFIPK